MNARPVNYVMLGALLVFIACPVEAKLTWSIADIGAPIAPDTEARAIVGTVALDCQSLLQLAPPGLAKEITVTVSFEAPSGVVASGPMNLIVPNESCTLDPMGSLSQPAHFTLAASREVPGLVPLTLDSKAEIGGNQLVAAQSASTSNSFVVGYYPHIQATVAENIMMMPPGGQATFKLTVTNLGNAATLVTPALQVDASAPFTVQVPTALVLERGATSDLDIVVTAGSSAGWNNDDDAFQVTLQPTAAFDQSLEGPQMTINMLARVRGLSANGDANSSPLPAPAALIVVVLGAALIAARRRA